MDSDRAGRGAGRNLLIHATNAWNPTGRNLQQVPGTRLFFAHVENLDGRRTFVLLGNQHHLTFVADFPEHVEPASLRDLVLAQAGLYPYQVDLSPAPNLPRVKDGRQ